MLGNLRHTHSVGALLLGVAAVLGGEKVVLGPGVGAAVTGLGAAYDAWLATLGGALVAVGALGGAL
jgi:hypothetical protein